MKLSKFSYVSAGMTIAILLGLGIFSKSLSVQKVDLVRESLNNFPTRIGEYISEDLDIGDKALGVLAPTEVLMRVYANPEGQAATLYIPFFEAQNDRSRIHSPKSCMVGGGYQFVRLEPYHLKYRGRDAVVNWVLTQKGDDKQVVLYWIQSRGRIITNEYIDKLYLMWDAIARHRTDGALVRCIVPVMKGESLEDANRRLAEFAQMVMDETPKYLPE
ncbi:MAG: exosortase C-terminal domain/associated protein EpsI [bacterium]